MKKTLKFEGLDAEKHVLGYVCKPTQRPRRPPKPLWVLLASSEGLEGAPNPPKIALTQCVRNFRFCWPQERAPLKALKGHPKKPRAEDIVLGFPRP